MQKFAEKFFLKHQADIGNIISSITKEGLAEISRQHPSATGAIALLLTHDGAVAGGKCSALTANQVFTQSDTEDARIFCHVTYTDTEIRKFANGHQKAVVTSDVPGVDLSISHEEYSFSAYDKITSSTINLRFKLSIGCSVAVNSLSSSADTNPLFDAASIVEYLHEVAPRKIRRFQQELLSEFPRQVLPTESAGTVALQPS